MGFSDATDGAVDADDPAGEFDVHADNAKLDISAVATEPPPAEAGGFGFAAEAA